MLFTSLSAAGRLLIIFGISSILLLTQGQDDDWVDPFDMLNYDATSKTMRKPPEVRMHHSTSSVLYKMYQAREESC